MRKPAEATVSPTEAPKSPAEAPIPVPPHLQGAGWRKIALKKHPKILYGMVREGSNYIAVRIEVAPNGSVLTLALPDNMKAIAADRLIDLMLTEAQ